MKPIYFRDVERDGTLGYRVIWPAHGMFSIARFICFVRTEHEAKSVVEWLTETGDGDV